MMPATSLKQKKFMDAAAHNPSFAKQAGIPQPVAQDFSEASKGMKFGSAPKTRADSQKINSPKTNQGKQELFKKGGSMATKKMNPFAKFEKSGKDVEMKGKGKEGSKKEEAFDQAQMMGMKKGGMSMAAFEKSGKDVEKKGVKEGSKADMALDKKQMMGMKKGGGVKKMAAGGFTREADGVATKGKTKATQISMPGNKGMKRGGKV